MYEMVLQIDLFKTSSERKAPKIFGMLESIGGISSVFQIIFQIVGSYFANAFFYASFGSKFFVERKPSKEID